MGSVLSSKSIAWFAFLLIIIVLIFTFSIRPSWWAFIDIFFGFMMVFCHIVAVYSRGKMPAVGRQMDTIAAYCGILAVLAFIGEFIAWQVTIK